MILRISGLSVVLVASACTRRAEPDASGGSDAAPEMSLLDAQDEIPTLDAVNAPTASDDLDTIDALDDSAAEPDVPMDLDARDGLAPLDVLDPPDAVAQCSAPAFVVDPAAGESHHASLARSDHGFGVAWDDDREGNRNVYFARIDPDGTVHPSVALTHDPADDVEPSVAWDGSQFWIAWSHTGGASGTDAILLSSQSPEGGATSTPSPITSAAASLPGDPALAVVSDGFVVAWDDLRVDPGNRELFAAHLDARGHRTGDERRLTNAPRTSYEPHLAWNAADGEFGLLWLDDRDATGSLPNESLYFAGLRSDGTRPAGAADVRVTNGPYRAVWPSIAYDGTGYAIAWANEGSIPDTPHIFFAQLTTDGEHRDGSMDVQVSGNPPAVGAWTTAIGWDGAEYGLIWEDQRHPSGDLVVRRIAPDGTLIGPEVFLDDDRVFSGHPTLVWSGSAWAVAWEDDRGGGARQIYVRTFARNACLGM